MLLHIFYLASVAVKIIAFIFIFYLVSVLFNETEKLAAFQN